MIKGKKIFMKKEPNGDHTVAKLTVAIVGGGFSGATLAAQLLRSSGGRVSVVLIEKGARLGQGVAYSTQCAEHLLNVPARNMSAYADDSDHFLEWARLHHHPGVSPDDYLPRMVYGQYIAAVLRQEIDRHPGEIERVQDEACSVTQVGNTAAVRLRSRRTIFADKVVLALGNFPAGDPRLPGKTPESQRYISNPWRFDELGDVTDDESVLLVGSGLTSVDVAVSLRRQGFRGTVHFLSRRGLLPQTHKGAALWPPFWDARSPRTIRGLLRIVRNQAEAAKTAGTDWRAVIDSLRPVTQEIWRSLSFAERRRFLRHLRPYWDVHRHRVAPAIGTRLASQIQDGQIKLHAGRITEYTEDGNGVDVTYRDRVSGQFERLRVNRVINCTGPEGDCRRVNDPFVTNLIRQKLARPDALFLGLETSADGALVDAQGVASDLLYAIGPIRKGSLWETIAVPELRDQVSELSRLLLDVRNEDVRNESDRKPIQRETFAPHAPRRISKAEAPALVTDL